MRFKDDKLLPGIPTGKVMDGGNCYADQGHVPKEN